MPKLLLATVALLALAAPANATICWNGVCGPSKEIIQFDKNIVDVTIDETGSSTAGHLDSGESTFTMTTTSGAIFTMMTTSEDYLVFGALPTVVPAVPEASTWAMIILGFLSVGIVGLRQRLHRRA